MSNASSYHSPNWSTASTHTSITFSVLDFDSPHLSVKEDELVYLTITSGTEGDGGVLESTNNAPTPTNDPPEWQPFRLLALSNENDLSVRWVQYNSDSNASGHRMIPHYCHADPKNFCVLCRTNDHLTYECMAPIPF